MTPTRPRRWFRLWSALVPLTLACSADRHRSPVCGMALLVGPSLIQQQLNDARAILTDVPRGLPDTVPARVAGQADTAHAVVELLQGQLALRYEGAHFPPAVSDSAVYGLLVVDDSTQRVVGLLVYEGLTPPKEFPRLGSVSSGTVGIPLFGVRVNWADVSNPRCPLLGVVESS